MMLSLAFIPIFKFVSTEVIFTSAVNSTSESAEEKPPVFLFELGAIDVISPR
jgi:hypothetical protein